MRLRSNNVLEPVSEWQSTRQRRRTRGASAQPEQAPEPTERVTSTPARQARTPARQARTPARAARRRPPAIQEQAESTQESSTQGLVTAETLSPIMSPLSPPLDIPTPSGFTPSAARLAPQDTDTSAVPRSRLSSAPIVPLDSPRTPHGLTTSPPFGAEDAVPCSPADQVMTSTEQPLKANEDATPQPEVPSVAAPAEQTTRRRLSLPRLPLPRLPRGRFRMPPFFWGSASEHLTGIRRPVFTERWRARRRLAEMSYSLRRRREPSPDLPGTPPHECELTDPEDEPRKRNRDPEDATPTKRHKSSHPSTPIGTPLRDRSSSRTTYADRTRRRHAEAGGRIHSTMFRVPEYLAQQDADATSVPISDDANRTNEPTINREAVAARGSSLSSALPETENRVGWSRWIFDKVHRRWTGLLGRTSSSEEELTSSSQEEPSTERVEAASDQQPQNETLIAVPSSAPARSATAPPIRDSPTPASRIRGGSRRIARPRQRYNDYDLFNPGFSAEQRARWNLDTPIVPAVPAVPAAPVTSAPTASDQGHSTPSQAQGPEATVSTKRKRQPSPDRIPNPPGCSYGLHDDYFIYDDEDWEAQEQSQRNNESTDVLTTDAPVPKRQRVDRPPGFNYQGHFEVPYSPSSSEGTGESPASSNHEGDSEAPGWSPGSSSISSSTRSTPLPPCPTGARPRQQPTVENIETNSHANRENAKRKSSTVGIDSQAGPNDSELVNKAREHAQPYKPKTPSRLRAAHRFSSSCTSRGSNAPTPFSEPRRSELKDAGYTRETVDNSEDATRRRLMRKTSLAKACPTGDLSNVIWPEFDTWSNRLHCFIDEDTITTCANNRQWQANRASLQEEFDRRFEQELAKKRADPDYAPEMWGYGMF